MQEFVGSRTDLGSDQPASKRVVQASHAFLWRQGVLLWKYLKCRPATFVPFSCITKPRRNLAGRTLGVGTLPHFVHKSLSHFAFVRLLVAGLEHVFNGPNLQRAFVVIVLEAQFLTHFVKAFLCKALIGPAATKSVDPWSTLTWALIGADQSLRGCKRPWRHWSGRGAQSKGPSCKAALRSLAGIGLPNETRVPPTLHVN